MVVVFWWMVVVWFFCVVSFFEGGVGGVVGCVWVFCGVFGY